MEKKVLLVTIIAITLISLSLISAINLEVASKAISDAYINGLNEPATFELTIKNLGDSDNFQVYSLIGVDIEPEKPFFIASGETAIINIKLTPQEFLKAYRKGYFVFEYIIKNSKNELQKQKLIINIIDLKDSVSVIAKDINPESQEVTLTIRNNVMRNLDDLRLKITCPFFEIEQSIPLKSLESKEIKVAIDKEKLKVLEAGEYTISTQISTNNKIVNTQSKIKFLEQENIKTTDSASGIIIRDHSISKENIGNIKKSATINAKKNIISYLFTTFDVKPAETRINGFAVSYSWEKQLSPGDELAVTITTNWFYPLIIVIIIIVAIWLVIKYIEEDVSLRKNVSYVKTRGGEFALKITLRIKAKKHLDNIKITDHLPHLVHLYEKYGAIAPDHVDLKERKLEWNLISLQAGEEKIFSYIVYSKIGVVGKFELPHARASYELSGKTKQMFSNKAVYVNELSP